MKKLLPLLFVIMSCQPQSKVLMTIDDRDISADEFVRIYNKNSSITLEEKKSVEDYLDLFINYKLKVIEAENLGYDTIPAFIQEMDGYTKQLAKPYLDQNTSMDSIVREVYNRYTQEVNASHILIKVDKNALPKDTLRVYNRILALRDTILARSDKKGLSTKEAWDQVIDENSRNPENKIGSDLGWFGTFRMLYSFEEAAYNTPVNGISMPIRTMYGYHLVRVNDKRAYRGEVNARHIMTIIPRSNASDLEVEAAHKKIVKAYEALQNGAEWDSIAKEYSEHKSTYFMGGKLGWIKSGNAPEELLDECFKLKPGETSGIFRSEYGYHIARVDEIKSLQSFEEVKDDFAKKLSQMSEIVKIREEHRQNAIRKEYGYKWYEENLQKLYAVLDSTLFTGEWDPLVAKDLNDPLFVIGDSTYTLYDGARKIGERRISYKGIPLPMTVRAKLLLYANEKVIEYELLHLADKYPEYGYLVQEYHDGILLFNLTEDEVWRKAVDDTTGLEAFYNALPEKYRWEDRIAISRFTFADSNLTDKILTLASERPEEMKADEFIKQICGEATAGCISVNEYKYEKGDNAVADDMTWEKGAYKLSKDADNFVLYYVDAIVPAGEKTLEDARGLYTADYQSYLEEKWVAGLREKYTIDIDMKVLERIKKEESKK
ncbi:MAG: peptidylprolyl isomerase [Bacteroidales bacterium]|nr:peptidylprolyl isomerase [Bacteroidales bacterium]